MNAGLTGIICAMKSEAELLLAEMTEKEARQISGIWFTQGVLSGQPVVLAVCGVGKVFAAICTEAMILTYKPARILNSGVAGTLTKELHIGDLALAESVVQHDMDISSLGDPVGLLPGLNLINIPTAATLLEAVETSAAALGVSCKRGVIASGDLFVHKDEQRDVLRERFSAIACEMESGAIAHVCYVNQVDCAIIRAISDGEGEDASMEFAAFEKKAAAQAAAITLDLLKNLPAV